MSTQFHPPTGNDRLPTDAAAVLATLLHDAGHSSGQRPIVTLSVTGSHGEVAWRIDAVPAVERRFAELLLNAYPGSSTTPVEPPKNQVTTPITDGFTTWTQNVRLTPWMTPLASLNQFIDPSERLFSDPLATLLTAMQSGRRNRVRATVQLHLQPATAKLLRRARRLARFNDPDHRLRHALVRWTGHDRRMVRTLSRFALALMTPVSEPAEKIATKLGQRLLRAQLRIIVTGPVDAKQIIRRKMDEIVRSLAPLVAGEGEFMPGVIKQVKGKNDPRHWTGSSFLLTPDEAAMLWHPPTNRLAVPRIGHAEMYELPPPQKLSSKEKSGHATTLGRVRFRSDRRRFGIDLDARRRHLYLTGKTGMGKSTLLLNLVAEDLATGRGITLIDPHGDLAEAALAAVPPSRTNETVLFDAGDTTHALAFNPLAVPSGSDPTLVADGVLTAFQKVFGLEEGSAPRLLYIFRNCLLTLVGQPGATLLSVQRLLIDERYREPLLRQVTNPVVKQFWTGEFGRWKPADRTAFVASLQNKLGAFTANQRLQCILGQPDNKLDLQQIMNTGQPLIVNLSKGRVGENAANLLGALLVSSLQLAAMSRSSIPEEERTDHSIVIDEFQNYATPAIATFLSESRKMRVHTVLAHQYLGQLDETIRDAVIGNVGSMIVFQLGADDSEFFARQLGGKIEPEHLMDLPKYHAYARLLMDGVPSQPFSMSTLAPQQRQKQRAEIVRRVARQRLGRPVSEVNRLISQQLGQ